MSQPLILVVDDQAEVRDIIALMLSRWGYHIVTVTSGAEAVEMAHLHSPDLILMDLRMPKMDGREATRLLKSQETTRTIPVLAVTASELRDSAEQLHEMGFCGYAMKPISPADLRASIEIALLGRPVST